MALSRNAQTVKEFVHKIVAESFIGPCPARHEVNHKDTNRENPRATNLEYVTRKQNIEHAVAAGSREGDPRGVKKPGARLNDAIVRDIRTSSDSLRVLGKRYGVSGVTVLKIKRREKWGHVE